MDAPLLIRGRRIIESDLVFIRSIIEKHQAQGRKFIAQELCRLWNWKQRNGMAKTMACSELLLRLERAGHVELPARKKGPGSGPRRRHPVAIPFHCQSPIGASLQELGPIEIRMVRATPWEPLYKGLLAAYHYLGYCRTVGEHLHYIAFHQDRPLACMGWGAAAWKVLCRDQFIGWSPSTRSNNLLFIVNNTRFLILPWVRIPHLASHLLSQNIKVLPSDWYQWYHYRPVLLETFVEGERFAGTSYKAANWLRVGRTQGRGKNDRHHQNHVAVKEVFLYPLQKDFREILNHESDR